MLKINLSQCVDGEKYFEIATEEGIFFTSNMIAGLLNLDLAKYNNLLVEKVIKHNDFIINKHTKDLSFTDKNIPMETYINRFKETFINELTLFTLGGD